MAGILSTLLNNRPKENQSEEIVKPSIPLMEWEAPEREFKIHPREYYRKIAVIVAFIAIIALIMNDYALMLVIGIVFFVVYVFHTIPPKNVRHKITSNGIDYGSEHLYKWSELKSFYIEKPPESQYYRLLIDTIEPIPGRLILLIDNQVDRVVLSGLINEHISINESPEVGILDKVLSRISRRLNI